MARPGFSFLIGADRALLKEETARQIAKFAPEASGWKRLTFWGDDELDERFWSSLDQGGLFEEKRLVIVRRADQFTAAVWQDISGRLARELAHVWPFFWLESTGEGSDQKVPAAIQKTPCFGFAERNKWVWRSSASRRDIAANLRQAASERGLKFAEGCFDAFLAFAAASQWQQVQNELDKLALLAADGLVSKELLAAGQYEPESGAFTIVNAIRAGDAHAALKEAASAADDSLLFFTIAVLDRDLRDRWKSLPEMVPDAGKRGFGRRQGKTLNAAEISRGFALLADAEFRIKSGQTNPAQTLEFLCNSMSAIFAPRP